MNTEQLFIEAMKACAEAHRCGFEDLRADDYQVALYSETVPTVADVQTICRAVFGNSSMVDPGWGFTTVYLDEAPFLEKPDMELLHTALPYGTVLPEERKAKAAEAYRRMKDVKPASKGVKHKK